MFKLVKLTLLGAVGVAALGYFVFGDHAVSYLSTMTGSVRDGVRGKIPVEFEIKRAEKLIKAIEPEIDNCKRDVARAEVELEGLKDDVERIDGEIARAEKKLKSTAGLVASTDERGATTYKLASHGLVDHRVAMDLERTFDLYKGNLSVARGKKALIERQERAVTAARARLDAVRTEKGKLEDTIGMLKTQKAQLDALAAGTRHFDLDTSNLGKAKEVLADVKKRLDVAQRMIEDDSYFAGTSDDRSKSNRDIGKEIREYFTPNSGATASVELGAPKAVLPCTEK